MIDITRNMKVVGLGLAAVAVAGLLVTMALTQTASAATCPAGGFLLNLRLGSRGTAVMDLQKFLNSDPDTMVAVSSFGSPGNETSYFGSLTRAAVIKFQNKYSAQVLAQWGLTAGTGYWGTSSRAHAGSICSGVVTPPPPTTGGALSVSAGTQPTNSLAVASAARVPFTNITLTAGASDVTVDSITVERTGLSADTNFSGVILIDADTGLQIGIAKTLNSNHQANVGEPFVIRAGTSRTVTVAANMVAAASLNAGEVASFTVRTINTTGSVSGTLPITGASHTINASLTIGSVTMARGSFDPGSNQTKEVGTTGYTFSSIKISAGSAEEIYLKSIRWNQTGSAGASDLANMVTIVDSTSYPTVVSSDGKYYTTSFPGSGILMDKGVSKDVSLKGDVAGGSSRTIDFDIAKRTDIYLVGKVYGYGITPPLAGSAASADSSNFHNADDYYYDASQVTIAGGSINISSWVAGVPAQNVAVNVNDQPIAGYIVDVKGEAISVGSFAFNVTLVESSGTAVTLASLDSVKLIKEDGAVLAGPTDASGTGDAGTVTLSNTYTFPVGITRVKLVGKLSTDFDTNDTVAASTTPSTQWTSVTGQLTGTTRTPAPASAISGPTQTVKAGALTVSVSTLPPAQTVIAGSKQFTFANYIFDAGQSGEDVRVTSIPLYYSTSGTRTDLTNCTMYDGTVAANSGSNVLNPTTSDTASSTTLTFDGTGLILPKGTTKNMALKCDVITGTTSAYWWGLDSAATMTSATGVTSGSTIAETLVEANGQVMTAAASGSYTVANDTSVLYKISQANSSNVTLAAFRFTAGTSEDIDLKQIAFQLGNTASNSPADLINQQASVWNGTTQVGTAQFGSGNQADNATSTLSTAVRIPRGTTVTLTVKGSLTAHDGITGTPGAFLAITYDGNNNGSATSATGNYATGVSSGATLGGSTTSDVTTNGLRIFRTVPTVEVIACGSSTYSCSALAAGADLYRVKVTVPEASTGANGISIRNMTFQVTSVGIDTFTGIQLFGPSGAVNASGVATTSTNRAVINFDDTAVDRVVLPGNSKTYTLRASSVSPLTASNVETISVKLLQDTGYPSLSTAMGTVILVQASASTSDRFIWSPFSTTSPESTAASNDNLDWTNSYGMPGFPTVGQDFSVQSVNH